MPTSSFKKLSTTGIVLFFVICLGLIITFFTWYNQPHSENYEPPEVKYIPNTIEKYETETKELSGICLIGEKPPIEGYKCERQKFVKKNRGPTSKFVGNWNKITKVKDPIKENFKQKHIVMKKNDKKLLERENGIIPKLENCEKAFKGDGFALKSSDKCEENSTCKRVDNIGTRICVPNYML